MSVAITKRTLPSCATSWRVKIFYQQRLVSQRSVARLAEARRWEADQESKLRSGDWIDPGRGKVPFRQAAEEWQASRDNLAVRSQETTRFLLERDILPTLGRMPVASITSIDVQKVLATMTRRGIAVSSQRRALSVVRLVLEAAVQDRRIARNAARDVKLPRGRTQREPRWLTVEQLARLTEAVTPQCRPVVLFLGLTGLRFSEMAALTVGDVVDTPHGLGIRVHRAAPQSKITSRAVIGSTKTHRSRTVPVPESLKPYIEQRRDYAERDDFLFPSPHGVIWTNTNFRHRSKWRTAVREAGLEGTTIHDLRHTAASLLIAAGADAKAVQHLLGHADRVDDHGPLRTPVQRRTVARDEPHADDRPAST